MKKFVTNQFEFDSIPEDFRGEIHITGILDRINKFFKNAYVYVYENAQIRYVYENAQISNVYENAQISNVSGNAQIRYVYENAQISNVYENAQISNVSGNAQIRYVYENASILNCSGRADIETSGQNIISYEKSQTNLKIKASSSTTIVVLDEMNCTFDNYRKFYPTEVKGENVILYKCVQKINDKYVSDRDKNFEYKIGETKQHTCNPSTEESCTYGLHVSHKLWALKFGANWKNMALLECSVPMDKIVVARDCDGKVRTSELTVLREVPESEYYS